MLLSQFFPYITWANNPTTIDLNALFKIEWAYGIVEPGSQKMEFVFEPEMNIEFENSHQ